MADPSSIPIEELARIPAPGTSAPVAVAFRPGPGEADSPPLVTYLLAPPDSLDRELHALDPATGETRRFLEPPGAGVREEALSREEQLRRERQREMGLGISRYAWAESAPVLMLPQPDGVWLADADGANVRRAVEGPVLDPQLSPDGRRVAYVRDGELWVDDRRFTHDADPANAGTNGLAEFIAQEEMGRSEGFWVSPDGTLVAYEQADEGHIPIYPIVHQGTAEWSVEEHRYPFPGK
ncbi:MAG TPA: DPP IV N-terminal domain-containing protein, partial [Acidimicrobiales bacterium]|nr:DPP IV N-terminal domain-containing protein [Acidimicrobiales bacterium]